MYSPRFLPHEAAMAEQLIHQALQEDVIDFSSRGAHGDHTSMACIPADTRSAMQLIAKEEGILSGVPVAGWVCHQVDPHIELSVRKTDGDQVTFGDVVFVAEGSVRSLLRAERVLLNYLQRMSGIATLTNRFVNKVSHTTVRLLDTRKTTPNNRVFEKYAVRCGGGENHRFGLFDRIMIKDNHIDACGGIEEALNKVAAYKQQLQLPVPVEIETRNVQEIQAVLQHGGADRIMLDNFTPAEAKKGVILIGGKMETEISGGVNLDTIAAYPETGVDFISVGAFTHSAKALDFSFKVIKG
jgi:nicotinate-nucleotide pyrophosphorylase (carboxylating)